MVSSSVRENRRFFGAVSSTLQNSLSEKPWQKQTKIVQKLGVKDFVFRLGSRLVSGKYPEPEEPIGVSKSRNLPCFWLHLFACQIVLSTSSSNIV